MGSVKLRRYAVSDVQRLGVLLAKVKEGVASSSEESELLKLIKDAQRISDSNAKAIAELRGVQLPPLPPTKTYAKSS